MKKEISIGKIILISIVAFALGGLTAVIYFVINNKYGIATFCALMLLIEVSFINVGLNCSILYQQTKNKK